MKENFTMKNSKFSKAQIVKILKQAESGGFWLGSFSASIE
jgi:hypothetical protein